MNCFFLDRNDLMINMNSSLILIPEKPKMESNSSSDDSPEENIKLDYLSDENENTSKNIRRNTYIPSPPPPPYYLT